MASSESFKYILGRAETDQGEELSQSLLHMFQVMIYSSHLAHFDLM